MGLSRFSALVVACSLFVGACTETTSVGMTATTLVNGQLPSPGGVEPTRADYRIAPQDVIDVHVYQFNDLTRSLQVDSAGNVVMPLIGKIRASGKTVREIEGDIAGKLGARFIQDPQVSVSIKSAIGLQVIVDGAVKKPGTYMATGEMSLLRVLAEAQGFTDVAAQREVLVFRPTPNGKMVAKFDANAIRTGNAPDPPIYGGDTVVVDDSTIKTAWKQFREAIPAIGLFRLFV